VAGFFTERTVSWEKGGSVRMIDQTKLPGRLTHVTLARPEQVADAIRRMVVRGAPAIGVAAAMGVALAAVHSKARSKADIMREVANAGALLRETRPTAVNLFWGIDRVQEVAESAETPAELRKAVAHEVKAMEEEDIAVNRKLGRIGADLVEDGDILLTQCNAGALATVGYGTALGVVRAAREQGKFVKVIVPETRPALQGARLTAFELHTDGIDCVVTPDTAVGHLLKSGEVDKVFVGADRITRDGYTFNKIGTYQISVLADRHGVPFYPVAPASTFDLRHDQSEITIEERSFDEVAKIRGRRIVPKGVSILNPAFDSTPPELVTAIVTDKGIIGQPLARNIADTMG